MIEHGGLLTDLYQITMAYGYWKLGIADREAGFCLQFRTQPFEGGFTVAAGLEDVGRVRANPAPQAAPFGHAAGHDLLGLARDRSRATPLADFDGLRRGSCREAQQHGDSER